MHPLSTFLKISSIVGVLSITSLVGGGCQAEPAAPQDTASSALTSPAFDSPATRPLVASASHRVRPGQRFVHRIPGGSCVVVVPPPPAWAVRPDGTVKDPSEIHRHKDDSEQILFLNFDGPHMVAGNSDDPENNTSHIPPSDVDVPAFDYTPFVTDTLQTRAQVIDAIVRWVTYYYADMNVRVTSERPPSGWAYTMMVIGGSPQIIGEQTGVLGVATWDCYQDPNNVGFVFSEDHDNRLEMLVLTIVHESGHTFGLAHIDNSQAIMYPANPGSDAYWGSGSTTDSYTCAGGTTQDSYAVLQDMLGGREDGIPPWVEIQTPGQGAVVASSVDVLVNGTDNVVLAAVELFVDGSSVGREELPSFAFQISGLTDGPHELQALGEDAQGNQAQSDIVTVEVEGNCGALATCEPGLGAIGDACTSGADCASGVCAQTAEGASVCSRLCDGVTPCPLGTSCVQQDVEAADTAPAWCVAGSPPVVILQLDDGNDRLSGCATTAPGDAGLPFALLSLLWLLAVRRRR